MRRLLKQFEIDKTIVQIGDRIPSNLLREDEVLLQFYNITSSKMLVNDITFTNMNITP